MGATNDIKETNITLKLEGEECPNCQQKFTQAEIDERNFDLWFDTTNDIKLTEHLYPHYGYQFSIWIRSIEHQDCPEIINEYE